MKIAGFLKESYQDWDEGLTSVIFTAGCNHKCPSCHSGNLVNFSGQLYDEKEVLQTLGRRRKYVDRVVICGGEPTIQPNLAFFLEKLKELGLKVKLDTNGSMFAVLQELKEKRLVDYVALDVKGPRELYPQLVGREYVDFRDDVEKAMAITSQFPDYEFRTTIVPVLRNGRKQGYALTWFSKQEIREMAKWVSEFGDRYFLQPFVARDDEMLDSRFSKENLPREMHETPYNLLLKFRDVVREYVPKCEIRGKRS